MWSNAEIRYYVYLFVLTSGNCKVNDCRASLQCQLYFKIHPIVVHSIIYVIIILSVIPFLKIFKDNNYTLDKLRFIKECQKYIYIYTTLTMYELSSRNRNITLPKIDWFSSQTKGTKRTFIAYIYKCYNSAYYIHVDISTLYCFKISITAT